jgi:RNA polymerase sigma-70 factor (ECF subfamily)
LKFRIDDSSMTDTPGTDPGPQRGEILGLIRSRVRIRFAVGAEQFAECVLTRARDAGEDPIGYTRLLNLDDLYLASACALRDEQAWAEFGRLHFGFMREFARRFLRGPDAAELTDRVIADLWEKGKLGRFEGRSSLRTWLGAVVAHAALQAGKVARRRESEAEHDGGQIARMSAASATPEDEEAARVLAGITSEAIRGLPDQEKLLLLLHYEQGLSLDHIAPLLDSSKATLSRRLKQVREQVRATIERVARERYRSSGDEVRAKVDLGRLELDLSVLLGGTRSVKGTGGDGV